MVWENSKKNVELWKRRTKNEYLEPGGLTTGIAEMVVSKLIIWIYRKAY